jgi:hypothetical protein
MMYKLRIIKTANKYVIPAGAKRKAGIQNLP